MNIRLLGLFNSEIKLLNSSLRDLLIVLLLMFVHYLEYLNV
jgi:hypothetical protein